MSDGKIPVVVVSRCLGFEHCRYNGEIVSSPAVEKMKEYVEFVTVCPEVEIGLGVPRDPIRVVLDGKGKKLLQPSSGRDLTAAMNNFIADFMGRIGEVDGFILKGRSPSCGLYDTKIFGDMESDIPEGSGSGLFAGAVLEKFPHVPVEDETALEDLSVRENFLTRLFTFYRFRGVRAAGTVKALVDFHSRHKLMLLAYNQSAYRRCGPIAANRERRDPDTVINLYGKELRHVFAERPQKPSIINALQHGFGWVSEHLSPDEKRSFLDALNDYREGNISLPEVIHLLRSHAEHYGHQYLMEQFFLEPYPAELD